MAGLGCQVRGGLGRAEEGPAESPQNLLEVPCLSGSEWSSDARNLTSCRPQGKLRVGSRQPPVFVAFLVPVKKEVFALRQGLIL